MQFLTISRRNLERFKNSDFKPFIEKETEQARALYASGKLRQIWHRGDKGGACLIFEADNEQDVRDLINTLPLVAAGMLEIEAVIPLMPYKGFFPSST